MRLVVALGGNALLRRGEAAEAAIQRAHVLEAASALAALAADHELVVTHGNEPQVGLLALEAETYDAVAPYPLDVLGAESQGMIGYFLAQALRNELPGREVVAMLTQVVVDRDDPAFAEPTQPLGPIYEPDEGRRLASQRGWRVAPDGTHVRRVVPSPEPRAIVELRPIVRLLEAGAIVVCGGGGGIPVIGGAGRFAGAEAVIDKDLTAALLAEELEADRLILLTDVSCVERDWRTPRARPIELATPDSLRRLSFAAGSMQPKIEAVCRFVERTGGTASIGPLADAVAVFAGEMGTQVVPRHVTARLRVRGVSTVH